MTLEEAIITKLQQLPKEKREQVLLLMDEWIRQHRMADTQEAQQAVATVQTTWATLALSPETLRWAAEDKELEYDLG